MEAAQATAALHAWQTLTHKKPHNGAKHNGNGNGALPNGRLSSGDVTLILTGLKRLQKVAAHP